MNILYISTAITQNELDCQKKYLKTNKNYTQSGMIESTMKFHGLILNGLSKNDVKVLALSGRMVSNNYKKIFWKGKIENINDKLMYEYIPTINIPIIKNIWNIIQYTIKISKWIRDNKKEEKAIVIDGAYVSIVPIIARINSCKKVCVVADIYDYMTDVQTNNGRKLGVFKNIINKNYKKMDGYILLTEHMNNIINKGKKPYMLLEGIADINDITETEKTLENKENKKTIMYAGALNEKYGLKNLLNAFKKYENNDIELWLFGDGPYVEQIIKDSKEDKRIKFKGVVNNEEIVKNEINSDLLINPRQNLEEFTKYSFPSKNMEYMKSGTPMLGVKLSGIPEEYYKHMYTMESGDENDILQSIKSIFDKENESNRRKKGLEAKKFVEENKNNKYQARRILNFIKSIK